MKYLIVFLLFVSGLSHAETIPATATAAGSTVAPAQKFWTGSGTKYSTFADVCNVSWGAGITYPSGNCTNTGVQGWAGNGGTAGVCKAWNAGSTSCTSRTVYSVYECGAGYTYRSSDQQCVKDQTTYSCPTTGGWTLSGQNCTRPDCDPGQTRDSNGACVVSCPAAGSSAMVGGAKAWGISGTSTTCTSGIAFGGCGITCTSGVGSGGKASCTGCTFTGTPSAGQPLGAPVSTSEIEAPTKPADCLATGKGYVTSSSGVTTCMGASESPSTVESTTKTKETSTDPNAPATTETTTKVECDGAGCKETKTTTTPQGTTTSTENMDPQSYCSKNPTAAMCKGEEKDECEDNPDRMGCVKLGTPTDEVEVDTSPVGVSQVQPVSVGGGGHCPADVTLPRGQVFTWAPICQFAVTIRLIILILAWVVAAWIVLGFGAKDNG